MSKFLQQYRDEVTGVRGETGQFLTRSELAEAMVANGFSRSEAVEAQSFFKTGGSQ